MIKIYTDGSSIGNPGKIGIGFVMYRNKTLIKKDSVYLGVQSNNFAEYMALIFSLIEAISMGEKDVQVFRIAIYYVNKTFIAKVNSLAQIVIMSINLAFSTYES